MSPRFQSSLVLGTLCAGLWLAGQVFAFQPPAGGLQLAQPAAGRRQQIDQAIVKALDFLAQQQLPSGAWSSDEIGPSPACTSLAIMAFLAAGHVPGEGPYAIQIERGIRWVVSQQSPNGLFLDRGTHGPMYTHGICSLMLAEVLGMTPQDSATPVRKALERAIELILIAQDVRKDARNAGGWRYLPNSTESDLSATGWQLLALRAAKNVGCDIPADCIDRAVGYVKKCAVPGNEGFGYQPSVGTTPVRAGTGILCLEICGEHHSAEALGAANYLMKRPLMSRDAFFYYGVYYCTVGMFQIGGQHWEVVRDHLEPLILSLQLPDGRWEPQQNEENRAGMIYCTSMAVLALSVEYQYLPIYQR
ncbi:MAG: Prenyltransferase/squalene oxidase [Planctomycetaceae bacterium]|nr:Prenyltransferase/squalene oxidase [Planctomycetaceae bacterium]